MYTDKAIFIEQGDKIILFQITLGKVHEVKLNLLQEVVDEILEKLGAQRNQTEKDSISFIFVFVLGYRETVGHNILDVKTPGPLKTCYMNFQRALSYLEDRG